MFCPCCNNIVIVFLTNNYYTDLSHGLKLNLRNLCVWNFWQTFLDLLIVALCSMMTWNIGVCVYRRFKGVFLAGRDLSFEQFSVFLVLSMWRWHVVVDNWMLPGASHSHCCPRCMMSEQKCCPVCHHGNEGIHKWGEIHENPQRFLFSDLLRKMVGKILVDRCILVAV